VAYLVFVAIVFELRAKLCGSAVLPDNGVIDGLAGFTIPDDGGLALVGNAEADDVARADAGAGEDLDGGAKLRSEDVHGIMFDPAGIGKMLSELMLGDAGDLAVVIEENSAGAGGALIEREDVLGHGCTCLLYSVQ
jgi:hypothetical protein